MPISAAVSTASDLDAALDEICESVLSGLGGAAPQLTFVFSSVHHAPEFSRLPQELRRRLRSEFLAGCTGEAVIGLEREFESGPCLSVWCAALDDVQLRSFALDFEQTPDGIVCSGLPDARPGESPRAIFLFGEPYSTSPQTALDVIADEYPSVPVVGGMAGGGGPGENRLFLNDDEIHGGAVGLILSGNVSLRTIVSQGCRPIGTPFVVTGARRNIVTSLGGVPPLRRLEAMYPDLAPRDRVLLEEGLHLGVAMNEYRDHFERGDFLIANVLGADRDSGAIAIGATVRTGQTVQFHLRDADTADEDLRLMLERYQSTASQPPQGALLFSCNGRGARFFSVPHHDSAAVTKHLGPLPLAGIFAHGELGPVAGRNYVHGYTASIVVFE
jgi:small ligand-binding sensory domain FIST